MLDTSSSVYPSEAAHASGAEAITSVPTTGTAIENADRLVPPQESRSSRAGLQIPIGRVHRHMKTLNPNNLKIGEHATVLLAAVLEYLIAEIWRLARDTTTSRIISNIHLRRVAENNEDIGELLLSHIDAVENAEDVIANDTEMEWIDSSEDSTCSPVPMADGKLK